MLSSSSTSTSLQALALVLCLSGVRAQSGGPLPPPTYGWNYSPTERDNEAISRNYQDVDIELRSPAFLWPETVPEGFANGTAGPTNDTVMGESILPEYQIPQSIC